jgi:hypothetical protein
MIWLPSNSFDIGSELSKALSHLSSELMEMNAADSGLEYARALTEWEQMLAALQRNDASVTTVDILEMAVDRDLVPQRCGHALGSALLHNTSVTSLTLDVSMLREEDEDDEEDEDQDPDSSASPIMIEDYELLINYVATSAALHQVCVDSSQSWPYVKDPFSVTFAAHLVRAVGSNSNIRVLRFGFSALYEPLSMVSLLNETTSLETLELEVSGHVLPYESRLMVAQALAINTQITHLNLKFGDDDGDGAVEIPPVLQVLHQNVTLRNLALQFDGRVVVPGDVWSSLLQSGIPLCVLDLCQARFNRDNMEHLLHGLINKSNAIGLKLHSCHFDHGSLDALVEFLPPIIKPLVSRLTIQNPHFGPDYPKWNLLTGTLYTFSPFHLGVLLDGDDTCALLRTLTSKSPRHMTSLALLRRLSTAETGALVTFVKSAVHLEKLSIVSDQSETFHTMLGEALRENGSLLHACEGLTDVYHRRNSNLRLLLVQRPMTLADLSLLPSLFQAAKAVKKMAANIIYTLTCSELFESRKTSPS